MAPHGMRKGKQTIETNKTPKHLPRRITLRRIIVGNLHTLIQAVLAGDRGHGAGVLVGLKSARGGAALVAYSPDWRLDDPGDRPGI